MTRDHVIFGLVALGLAGLPATLPAEPAPPPGPSATVPSSVLYLLSAFETLPTGDQLRELLPNSPEGRLLSMVQGTEVSVTVRLRAIRAMGQLDASPQVTSALVALLEQYRDHRAGTGLFYLIATIEALGQVGSLVELPQLLTALPHPSRDVRVAVVRALRVLRLPQAAPALEEHSTRETSDAVKNEITETLQTLKQLPQ